MFAKLKSIRVQLPKRLQLGLNKEQREEGVTLIELLAVVVILGIISAVAIPAVSSAINNAKINSTLNSEGTIQVALQRYYDQAGHYPSAISQLSTSHTNPATNNTYGPYVTNSFPENDGFGNPMYYAQINGGTGYIILSGDGNTLSANGSSSGVIESGGVANSFIYASGGTDVNSNNISSIPTVTAKGLPATLATDAGSAAFASN